MKRAITKKEWDRRSIDLWALIPAYFTRAHTLVHNAGLCSLYAAIRGVIATWAGISVLVLIKLEQQQIAVEMQQHGHQHRLAMQVRTQESQHACTTYAEAMSSLLFLAMLAWVKLAQVCLSMLQSDF